MNKVVVLIFTVFSIFSIVAQPARNPYRVKCIISEKKEDKEKYCKLCYDWQYQNCMNSALGVMQDGKKMCEDVASNGCPIEQKL